MTTGQTEPSALAAGGFNVSAFGTHGTVPKEAELDWFFSTGQSLFEASTFGALLERQAAYGQIFEPCTKCGGTGFDAADNTCPKCRGMGGSPEAREHVALQHGLLVTTSRCTACIKQRPKLWCCKVCDGYGCFPETGARCVKCKGSGMKLLKNGKPRKRPKPRERATCYACKGRLYHDRWPASVKAEAGGEPSYTPDDVALRRFAQVSRYLRQCSSETVEVLAAFFGVSGYLWANTKWGRLFAVVPLTRAGERTMAKLENPQDISDHLLLSNHVHELGKLKTEQERQRVREWTEAVTRQAAALFKAAAAEWRSVVDPRCGFEEIERKVAAA